VNIQPNYFALKKNMEIKDSAPKDEKVHTRNVVLGAVSEINGDVSMDDQRNASESSLVLLYASPEVIGFERKHVDGSGEMVDKFLLAEIGC